MNHETLPENMEASKGLFCSQVKNEQMTAKKKRFEVTEGVAVDERQVSSIHHNKMMERCSDKY